MPSGVVRPAAGPADLAWASGEEVDEQGNEDLVGDAVPLPVEDSCLTVGDGRRDRLGDLAGGFAALPAGQGQGRRGDVAEPIAWYGAVVAQPELVGQGERVGLHAGPVRPFLHLFQCLRGGAQE